MRTLAQDTASQGDKLTLVRLTERRWGFVPSAEVHPLPVNWPLFNRARRLWVDFLNLFFSEAKTEVVVPQGSRLRIKIPTDEVERVLGAVGNMEVLYHRDGLEVGDRVIPFVEFGELLGVEVVRIPLTAA
jgi:hypothetical protein